MCMQTQQGLKFSLFSPGMLVCRLVQKCEAERNNEKRMQLKKLHRRLESVSSACKCSSCFVQVILIALSIAMHVCIMLRLCSPMTACTILCRCHLLYAAACLQGHLPCPYVRHPTCSCSAAFSMVSHCLIALFQSSQVAGRTTA